MLYVLDHVDKKLIVIDPSCVSKWCEDIPRLFYGLPGSALHVLVEKCPECGDL